MRTKIKPRGLRNNNPLNIRKGSNWRGEIKHQTDNQFEQFESLEYGLRAGMKLIKNYIEGKSSAGKPLNTIEKIISRWAPPSENVTRKYIDYVCGCTGMHPAETISFQDREKICNIVQAMTMVECGQAVDLEVIKSAYDMV